MDTPWLREITTMSTINKEAKRYQNPELFERLAMEYAIGMLHGGARKRFEALMEKHLYLRATTEAYEHQFARLAELLPEEQPNPRVWKKVEKHTSKNVSKKKSEATAPWWQSLSVKMMGFAATVFLAVTALFVLLPTHTADAYVSVLESESHKPMAVAMANPDEGIEIKFVEEIKVPEGMELKLWCFPKKQGEKPMMMGTLASSGNSVIKLDSKMWQGLADVSTLAISLEPANMSKVESKTGKTLFEGSLKVLSENS